MAWLSLKRFREMTQYERDILAIQFALIGLFVLYAVVAFVLVKVGMPR